MGMSASQMRLLTLTTRQNDIELNAQLISNQKMQLTRESEVAAKDYTKALNEYQSTDVGNSNVTNAQIVASGYVIKKVGTTANGVTNLGSTVNIGTKSYADIQAMLTDGSHVLVSASTNQIKNSDKKINLNDISGQLSKSNNTLEMAKAIYESKTTELASKEKPLDMKLKQLDTERNAVKTEAETVKKLVGENIEKTFNVFG